MFLKTFSLLSFVCIGIFLRIVSSSNNEFALSRLYQNRGYTQENSGSQFYDTCTRSLSKKNMYFELEKLLSDQSLLEYRGYIHYIIALNVFRSIISKQSNEIDLFTKHLKESKDMGFIDQNVFDFLVILVAANPKIKELALKRFPYIEDVLNSTNIEDIDEIFVINSLNI